MGKPEMRKQWIEEELEQSLRRVGAPAELWDRVLSPQPARSRVHTRFMALATVPVVMLVALLGSHSKNASSMQLRSSDPLQIQAWVKAKTGLDVPMHGANLAGATVVSGTAAEIAYRGESDMTLRVSVGPAAARKNGNVLSWTAGGLNYQLACAEQQDLRACALCHVGG